MNTDTPRDDGSSELPELMQQLSSVDENTPEAAKNETSISDNNGGRIELNEGDANDNRIQGVDP